MRASFKVIWILRRKVAAVTLKYFCCDELIPFHEKPDTAARTLNAQRLRQEKALPRVAMTEIRSPCVSPALVGLASCPA
jgi:hypothetical protein